MLKSGKHTAAAADDNDALAREAALKRMGHMAQNFNFYSTEKGGHKKGHVKI